MKDWNAIFKKDFPFLSKFMQGAKLNPDSARVIALKDYQLVAWPLGIGGLIFALIALFQSGGSMGWGRDAFYFEVIYPGIVFILNFLLWILAVIIVPLVVQSDAIKGTKAFWLTKPISRENLFKAKMEFFFLPFYFLLLLSISSESGFALVLHYCILVLILWGIAALTVSLRNYLLVVTMGFIGVGVIATLFFIFAPETVSIILNLQNRSAGVHFVTPLILVEGVLIVLGLYLISYLYLRNSERSLVFILPYFVVLLLVFWTVGSWDSLMALSQKNNTISKLSTQQSIVVDLNDVRIAHIAAKRTQDFKTVVISTRINISGLSKDQFAVIRKIDAGLMKYDEKNQVLASMALPAPSMLSYRDERLSEPLQNSLKNKHLLNPFVNRFNIAPIFKLSQVDYQQYKGKKGEYAAAVTADIYNYCDVKNISLDPVPQYLVDSYNRVIEKFKTADGLTVVLYEYKSPLWNGVTGTINKSALNEDESFTEVYFLVNSKTQEAFIAEAVRRSPLNVLPAVNWGSQIPYTIKRIDFTFLNDRNVGLPVIDDAWLKDAKLVRVSARYLKTIEKSVQFDNFYLPVKESFATEASR